MPTKMMPSPCVTTVAARIMYSSSNALNAAPDLQSTLLLCVCCDKVGFGHYSRVLHFWILQVWTHSIVSRGSTYPLRYRRTAEVYESVWMSSTALCIWRTPIYFQNGVNSAPPPQTNQTSQRPLIPDLTIWRFKVNQLSQKIFLLSLFFVWFGRIPPVWSLRNNKFSPSDKSKESSTYQYLFSQ